MTKTIRPVTPLNQNYAVPLVLPSSRSHSCHTPLAEAAESVDFCLTMAANLAANRRTLQVVLYIQAQSWWLQYATTRVVMFTLKSGRLWSILGSITADK